MNTLTATYVKINNMNGLNELNKIQTVINYPGLWDEKDRDLLNSAIDDRKTHVLNG